MGLVVLNFSQHVCLSVMADCNGGWGLLPWFPVYLNWYTFVDDDL